MVEVSDPDEPDRQETLRLIQEIRHRTNTKFPITRWTNYVMELMRWRTVGRSEKQREDPEYQILTRLWSTHDPSNIAERDHSNYSYYWEKKKTTEKQKQTHVSCKSNHSICHEVDLALH